jgi:N-acetylgalactosamine-N,N'-diacetylbacillosaminyl-diphospho-undecaprenol 4-alpha-N-acetylgalactosaminyltransferase
MRRRIAFVINSLAGGGAERVFSSILSASFPANGDDLSVVLLDREEQAYELPRELRRFQLDCGHSLALSIGRLARLLRRERADLTVSFLTRANVAAAIAMILRRQPFIISERVDTSAHLATGRFAWASRLLVRLTYRRAMAVIAVSDGVADTLVRDFGVDRRRIAVVFNPVDGDLIALRAAEEPAIEIHPDDCIAMGRLVPNKNFALAVEAFARANVPGRLVLLGQGPLHAELRALGDSLGLGERLVMPGFVANPYAVMARARLFILSSNAEGFPNALVEAMAVGLPVVATDCRAGPSQILATALNDRVMANGQGGVLVRPNDVDAMASAIARMSDRSICGDFSKSGRRRAADFGLHETVECYWRVIEAALGNQPQQR